MTFRTSCYFILLFPSTVFISFPHSLIEVSFIKEISLCNNWYYRKLQPTKIQNCGSQQQWIHLQKQPFLLRFREHCAKGCRKILRTRRSGSWHVRLCLLRISEAIPITSYWHDCLNNSWIRTTRTDMQKWLVESSWILSPTHELKATEESWEQEKWSYPGKSMLACYSTSCHPWKGAFK